MTVKEISDLLQLKILVGEEYLVEEVSGVYIGDLLSFVMSHAKEKNLWVTIQGHLNSVAVASLVGLSGIIIAEHAHVSDEMIEKAEEEGIPVLHSDLTSFEISYLLGEHKCFSK